MFLTIGQRKNADLRQAILPLGHDEVIFEYSEVFYGHASLVRYDLTQIICALPSNRGRHHSLGKLETISRHITALTGKRDVSVHTFHHTHISHALNRWERIPSVVQEMVGHKKLETTRLYLHVSKEDLHREIQKTG